MITTMLLIGVFLCGMIAGYCLHIGMDRRKVNQVVKRIEKSVDKIIKNKKSNQ
jgi:hypothetical protein